MSAATARRRFLAWIGALLFAASLIFFGVRYSAFFPAASGPWTSSAWSALAIDTALFSIFALHHSLFARMGLKARLARLCSPETERSVYVSIASVLFLLTCGAWQPLPGVVWAATGAASACLASAQILGIVVTLWSASRLDVLELAGVRQAEGTAARPLRLLDHGLYGVVRHPIYFGWLLLVWPVGTMTATRLCFATLSTLYLLVAIPFEERDLTRTFGPAYPAYAARVRRRLVPFIY